MDKTPQKHCTGLCEELLPATAEFFHRDKNRKDGLSPVCKVCKKHYDKDHFALPDVHKRRNDASKASYHNPEKHEQIRSQQKVYRNSPKGREYLIANSRKHYKNFDLAAYRSHPLVRERVRVQKNNRWARKKAVPGIHTPQESREQYDRQKGRCYYCALKVKWGYHHEDHIIPLTREGATNDISNIAITCATCNLRKQNKLPHEFFEGGKLL